MIDLLLVTVIVSSLVFVGMVIYGIIQLLRMDLSDWED